MICWNNNNLTHGVILNATTSDRALIWFERIETDQGNECSFSDSKNQVKKALKYAVV